MWLRDHSPGENVKLQVLRDGREIEISFSLSSQEDHHYSLSEMPGATERQRRIRDGILHGTTD